MSRPSLTSHTKAGRSVQRFTTSHKYHTLTYVFTSVSWQKFWKSFNFHSSDAYLFRCQSPHTTQSVFTCPGLLAIERTTLMLHSDRGCRPLCSVQCGGNIYFKYIKKSPCACQEGILKNGHIYMCEWHEDIWRNRIKLHRILNLTTWWRWPISHPGRFTHAQKVPATHWTG